MTLYAEHLGYLSTRPSDWPKTGPQSRFEAHVKRTGRPPPMPPVHVGGYLVRAFNVLGRVTHLPDGGRTTLSFVEMVSAFDWLSERERLILKDMSRAYLRGWVTGTDVLGIAPWEQDSK